MRFDTFDPLGLTGALAKVGPPDSDDAGQQTLYNSDHIK
jgi:hypothetical protein